MNELISIVMPVYNSSEFLENSINSVLCQTYKNIELILVDDNSTDESAKVINKFAIKDKRVIPVILKENLGVSNARNQGIKKANGIYITFIDSDDAYSDENVLLNISKTFDDSKQLYVFPIKKIYINENKPDTILKPEITTQMFDFNQTSSFRATFENYFKHSSCNKIFNLKIIKDNNIVFPTNIKMGEDLAFNAHYSLFTRKVQCIGNVFYNYYIHKGSSCRTDYDGQYKIDLFRNIFDYYKTMLKHYFDNKIVYSYLNIMIFTKMFASLFKHYKRSVKTVNLKLPKEYKKLCKQNLNKKDMLSIDYYFAKSYFNPLYRYTIFVFISINYYIRKLFKKN